MFLYDWCDIAAVGERLELNTIFRYDSIIISITGIANIQMTCKYDGNVFFTAITQALNKCTTIKWNCERSRE